jgi:zinc transporter, ZIP family
VVGVSLFTTTLLGFIAGVTILLGLPIGRLRTATPTLSALLNATAVGVLLFLFWDVLTAAWEPIDAALSAAHEGKGGLGAAAGYGVLFTVGLAVGLLSLVYYESWMAHQLIRVKAPVARESGRGGLGPGAMDVAEVSTHRASRLATWSPARRLSLLIAMGIGLHNFAEGLAIGQSSASGQLALALPLVIGFALHNGTEGFGIVAPLVSDTDAEGHKLVPTWGFLLAMGAIGGGPTVVGTMLGYQFTNEAVSVVFLTLAAGSILYVVTRLVAVAQKTRRSDLLAYGLLAGLVAGFLTDAIVTAAGA